MTLAGFIAKRRGRYVLDFYDCRGKRQRQTMMKEGSTLKQAKEALRNNRGPGGKRDSTWARAGYRRLRRSRKCGSRNKKGNLRLPTWEVYEGHTKNHFADLLDAKVNRITTATVEKFIMQRQGGSHADQHHSQDCRISQSDHEVRGPARLHPATTRWASAERPRAPTRSLRAGRIR